MDIVRDSERNQTSDKTVKTSDYAKALTASGRASDLPDPFDEIGRNFINDGQELTNQTQKG